MGWRLRLLEAEVLTVLGRPKEALPLLNTPVPDTPELAQLEVRRLIDLAAVASSKERPALLAKAKASATDPELKIRAALGEAVPEVIPHPQVAQARFLEALKLAESSNNPYYQAVTLANLSYSSKLLRQYEEAVRFGKQGVELADRIGARRIAALAHLNLGSAYYYLGEFESSLDNEQRAIAYYKPAADRRNHMIALGELGLANSGLGKDEEAIASYTQAFQLACELNSNRDAERHAGNLALSWIDAKNWGQADEWNRKALELAPKVDDKASIPYLVRNQARIAAGRGQPEEALRIYAGLLADKTTPPRIRWEAYGRTGRIEAEARQFAQANRDFERALRMIDENPAALSDSQLRMSLLTLFIPYYQDYVDALMQQNNPVAAIRISESSRAQVLTERMQRDNKPSRFPSLASLQAVARSTHSVLLSFWLVAAPYPSFAWLIAPDSVRTFRLPPAEEIEKRVTAYREIVEHPLKDPILANDPSGPELWNVLMREIGPAIPKGAHVIVIPDGALHRLNLETLVVPTPAPHYWIEDVTVAVAPSITVAAMPETGTPPARKSLLLIGAPDYTGSGFEPLKNAGKEVSDIAARFGSASQVTGPKAAPDAYKAQGPGNFSHIHFTAHAEADAQNPLSSAVILSGAQNRLFARDVIDIPLHADLVTISACKSAGVRSYAGEGLIGFAWAFLRAGARHVVAGLWDVSDSSTEPLMDRFYGEIAAGRDPVDALHNAKLALRRDLPHFSKPFYWAPFQTYIASAARAEKN